MSCRDLAISFVISPRSDSKFCCSSLACAKSSLGVIGDFSNAVSARCAEFCAFGRNSGTLFPIGPLVVILRITTVAPAKLEITGHFSDALPNEIHQPNLVAGSQSQTTVQVTCQAVESDRNRLTNPVEKKCLDRPRVESRPPAVSCPDLGRVGLDS